MDGQTAALKAKIYSRGGTFFFKEKIKGYERKINNKAFKPIGNPYLLVLQCCLFYNDFVLKKYISINYYQYFKTIAALYIY